MLVAPSITWLLVMTRPVEDRIMPVPSAVSLSYLSVEEMSTRPGSTRFSTSGRLSTADDAPLPDALLCGPGASLEATGAADPLLWLSRATLTPAPMLAARAATAI